jgi:hypothetical protein
MITFSVSKVDRGGAGELKQISLEESIRRRIGVQVEAAGSNQAGSFIEDSTNGFLGAVHTAYAYHYPLVLSPDDVWVAVAQGFATHVNKNAEALRSKFVKHEGKAEITIHRDHFSKGSPDNDWMGGFSEFSDRIAEHIGDSNRRLVVSDFSTTGPIEKAASEVVLMDTVKAYFDYRCRTMCGIPEITLLGGKGDWESIRQRAARFSDFGCSEWLRHLLPVLDRFVSVFEGSADPAFWEEFYKVRGGSGGPFVNGAINVFFPYLERGEANSHLDWKEWGRGPTTDSIPRGLSEVPFTWEYFLDEYPMVFIGGFVGTVQDGVAVRPALGWGVADA